MKNKGLRILSFVLVILATAGLGYVALMGIGNDKVGSYKDISQGLDLAGGLSITYQVVGEESPTNEDMNDTIEKLRNKAETYSTEAQVYQEGSDNDRITIEIPGISDASAVLEELGRPGSLYFISQTDNDGNLNYTYEVSLDGNLVYMDENFTKYIYVGEKSAVLYDEETLLAKVDENGNTIPFDLTQAEDEDISYVLLKPIDELLADGSIILEGTDVDHAKAAQQEDQQTKAKLNVVALEFNASGTEKFEL